MSGTDGKKGPGDGPAACAHGVTKACCRLGYVRRNGATRWGSYDAPVLVSGEAALGMLFPVTLLSPNFSKMLRSSKIICRWAARVAKSLDRSYSEERVRELLLLLLAKES